MLCRVTGSSGLLRPSPVVRQRTRSRGGDDLYEVWRFNAGAFVTDRVVYFTYQSSSPSNLPQRRETRVVPAGAATNGRDDGDAATTDDANSELTILRALRFDDSLKWFNDPGP